MTNLKTIVKIKDLKDEIKRLTEKAANLEKTLHDSARDFFSVPAYDSLNLTFEFDQTPCITASSPDVYSSARFAVIYDDAHCIYAGKNIKDIAGLIDNMNKWLNLEVKED